MYSTTYLAGEVSEGVSNTIGSLGKGRHLKDTHRTIPNHSLRVRVGVEKKEDEEAAKVVEVSHELCSVQRSSLSSRLVDIDCIVVR